MIVSQTLSPVACPVSILSRLHHVLILDRALRHTLRLTKQDCRIERAAAWYICVSFQGGIWSNSIVFYLWCKVTTCPFLDCPCLAVLSYVYACVQKNVCLLRLSLGVIVLVDTTWHVAAFLMTSKLGCLMWLICTAS